MIGFSGICHILLLFHFLQGLFFFKCACQLRDWCYHHEPGPLLIDYLFIFYYKLVLFFYKVFIIFFEHSSKCTVRILNICTSLGRFIFHIKCKQRQTFQHSKKLSNVKSIKSIIRVSRIRFHLSEQVPGNKVKVKAKIYKHLQLIDTNLCKPSILTTSKFTILSTLH